MIIKIKIINKRQATVALKIGRQTSAGVNHGEPRALFITSIDILTNGIRSGSWKLLDLRTLLVTKR